MYKVSRNCQLATIIDKNNLATLYHLLSSIDTNDRWDWTWNNPAAILSCQWVIQFNFRKS